MTKLRYAFLVMMSVVTISQECVANKPYSNDLIEVLFADGNEPRYENEGIYQNQTFYVVKPEWKKTEPQSGLLVNNAKIIAKLSNEEVEKIREYLAPQKILAQEKQRNFLLQVEQKEKEDLDKIKKLSREMDQRKKNIDVVSQVLNYSSGCSDDGCGTYSTWLARDVRNCIYDKVNLQDGSVLETINLNEMDPKSIQVVTMNRASTNREEIHDPRNWTSIVGYNNVITKYQTQDVLYMGKELFSEKNLDINRLKRGWSLIYSKYCSGTKKAF